MISEVGAGPCTVYYCTVRWGAGPCSASSTPGRSSVPPGTRSGTCCSPAIDGNTNANIWSEISQAGELWSTLGELGVEGAISLTRGALLEEPVCIARGAVHENSLVKGALQDELLSMPARGALLEEPPSGLKEKAVMHIVLGVQQQEEEEDEEIADVDRDGFEGHEITFAPPEEFFQKDLDDSEPSVRLVKKTREAEAYLECGECGGRFVSEINLRTHIADTHSAARCRDCGLVVRGSNSLVEHITSAHSRSDGTAVRPVPEYNSPVCNICHETFVTNQALRFHLYKHSGLKPFKCKICAVSFRTPSTLKSHVEVQHTESKHRCQVCGLKSSTSGKLKIHMRTHTNEKPYQCTFCPTSFKQLSVLRVHEFTHTKKSIHKCDRCGNFFPTKNRLISHMSKPVCVNRSRGPAAKSHQSRRARRSEPCVLEDRGLDRVTYLIHSEAASGLELEQEGAEYEPTMADLETGEIPVLVDNLPVIIETDMEGREEEEMAKHQEIMFSL